MWLWQVFDVVIGSDCIKMLESNVKERVYVKKRVDFKERVVVMSVYEVSKQEED